MFTGIRLLFLIMSFEVLTLIERVYAWEVNNVTRFKRQEERWIWSSDAEAETNHIDNRVTEEPNPCIPVVWPAAPDFKAPGRRISQVKCYEYMWAIKVITSEAKRLQDCSDHLLDIIGGRDALPLEFPHMAGIGWKTVSGEWNFKCGGSLISSKFVVTAAHCSMASDRDTSIIDVTPKIVRLGYNKISERSSNGQDAKIMKVITHPKYEPPKKYNDIALIELEKEVRFTMYVQPACLIVGPDDVLVGQKAMLTGWGVTDAADPTTSPELQVAEISVLDSRLCDRLYRRSCSRHWCGMAENQLCAGVLDGGVDACQGDSGGPLQLKFNLPRSNGENIYRLIGVTSFGIGCALPNYPGIYTRISSFLDWIEPIVWK
ncbi:hypothetical protein ACJJTC_016951 [Scirpophaga incertulas]